MWETAEPFLRDWLRSELGPEAYYADRLIELVGAVKLIPELIQRMDKYYPLRSEPRRHPRRWCWKLR